MTALPVTSPAGMTEDRSADEHYKAMAAVSAGGMAAHPDIQPMESGGDPAGTSIQATAVPRLGNEHRTCDTQSAEQAFDAYLKAWSVRIRKLNAEMKAQDKKVEKPRRFWVMD